MNDGKETLEQRIGKVADEARRTWFSTTETVGPWEAVSDSDKADWRKVVRPHLEHIAKLEAELTWAREAGQGYADEAVILRDENKALRAEVERLKQREESLTDHAQTQDQEIARAAEEVSVARGETAFEHSNVRDLKTTVRVLSGLLAAKGQS